ncbi:MAG: hypothetical protein WD555_05355 [Fulvivirga sp.]
MLKRFFIALAVLLSIIAVIFYYKLGGSKPLTFKVTSHPTIHVMGAYFEGKYNDPQLEKLFFNARERAEAIPGAALTVVNYQNDQNHNIIKQFIGSGTRIKPQHIPDQLELRTFARHNAISTTIAVHNAVMPTAETVSAEAKKIAKEEGYQIDSLSLEIYTSEWELKIIFPVKKGNK